MGKKNRSQKLSALVQFLITSSFLFQSQFVFAALTLNSSIEVSPKPLTTSQVWKLDQYEKNPHRKRWVLERNIELVGLKYDQGRMVAKELKANTVIHVREDSKWFKEMSKFPCTKKPVSWFATKQMNLKAAQKAAQLWEKKVKSHVPVLDVILKQTSEKDQKKAMSIIENRVRHWFMRMDEQWRSSTPSQLREQEWGEYIDQARKEGHCSELRARRRQDIEFEWNSLMPQSKQKKMARLVRLPAKRWNGIYSIRVNLEIDGKKLNGRFLVDPTVEENLVSPNFLIRQGVTLDRLVSNYIPNRKIDWNGKAIFGKWISIEALKLADQKVDLKNFWLADTKIFSGLDYTGECCDGVLGLGFFRKFALKFNPGMPASIEVYDRDRFAMTYGTPWFEIATDREGKLVSSCRMNSGDLQNHPVGVRWDFYQSEALNLNLKKRNQRKLGKEHSIQCHGFAVAPKLAHQKIIPRRFSFDVARLGWDLLDRGVFTLDLANGRIWFSAAALTKNPLMDAMGLKLGFKPGVLGKELRVLKIKDGISSTQLKAKGLQKNSLIKSINDKSANQYDLWEIRKLFRSQNDKAKITLRFHGKDGWKTEEVFLTTDSVHP